MVHINLFNWKWCLYLNLFCIFLIFCFYLFDGFTFSLYCFTIYALALELIFNNIRLNLNRFYHDILMKFVLEICYLHILVYFISYLWQNQFKIGITLKDEAIIFITLKICNPSYLFIQTRIIFIKIYLFFDKI